MDAVRTLQPGAGSDEVSELRNKILPPPVNFLASTAPIGVTLLSVFTLLTLLTLVTAVAAVVVVVAVVLRIPAVAGRQKCVSERLSRGRAGRLAIRRTISGAISWVRATIEYILFCSVCCTNVGDCASAGLAGERARDAVAACTSTSI